MADDREALRKQLSKQNTFRRILDKKNKENKKKESKRKHSVRPVDLQSTLAQFGSTIGFNVESYISEFYKTHHPDMAPAHLAELHTRRDFTSQALKHFVFEHYREFIDTSKEVINIEGDMLRLNHLLSDYKATMKQFGELKFSYPDSRMIKLRREREAAASNKASAAGAQLALTELVEDLGSLVYERKYEEAVNTIEDARRRIREVEKKNKAGVVAGGLGAVAKKRGPLKEDKSLVEARATVEEHTHELVDLFANELRDSGLPFRRKAQFINYLKRLNASDRALFIFLQNRSLQIKQAIRVIRFQGDSTLYVQELSNIVFPAIGAAAVDFERLFLNNSMMGGVVVWAVDQVEHFGHIFHKHLFQSDDLFPKLAKCLRIAMGACSALKKKGLSLTFVLARIFRPSLIEVIERNYKDIEHDIADALALESWRVTELWLQDQAAPKTSSNGKRTKGRRTKRALRLTDSGKFLYDVVRGLLKEVVPILDNSAHPESSLDVYPQVVQGIIHLFEGFLLTMAQQTKGKKQLTDTQNLSIVSNAFYLGDDLLPRVAREFERQYGQPVPELLAFRRKLLRLHDALQDSYIQRCALTCLEEVWQWREGASANAMYGAAEQEQAVAASTDLRLSPPVVKVVAYLVQIRGLALQCLPPRSVDPVMSMVVEDLMQLLHEKVYWSGLKMKQGGLLQFMFDLRALQTSCKPGYLTKTCTDAINSLMRRAVHLFCKASGKQSVDVIKPEDWFVAGVAQAVQLLPASIGAQFAAEMKSKEEKKKSASGGGTSAAKKNSGNEEWIPAKAASAKADASAALQQEKKAGGS